MLWSDQNPRKNSFLTRSGYGTPGANSARSLKNLPAPGKASGREDCGENTGDAGCSTHGPVGRMDSRMTNARRSADVHVRVVQTISRLMNLWASAFPACLRTARATECVQGEPGRRKASRNMGTGTSRRPELVNSRDHLPVLAAVGSMIRPRNRMLPVVRSRIRNRNGRFT